MNDRIRDILRHVLFVGPDLRCGGGIAYVANVYADTFGGITYAPTTSHRGKAWGALRFAMTMAMLPVYRLRGCRIVHAHGSVRGSWRRKCLLLRWAGLLGMRTIHHIHNGALRKHFPAMGIEKVTRQMAKADCVVALTDGWKSYLRDELGLCNVEVIENPVRPSRAVRKPLPGPLRMVFISAIDHTKGLFELLETLYDHRDELRGRVHLDIGGSGVDDARMNEFLSAHPMDDMIALHGWVAGEAKDALLENNDVFVLPSYAEGMPIALLEAMSAGLAAIVTPVGGIPEAVADGEGAVYVKVRDKDSIYQAIRRLADNPDEVDAMGARNRETVQRYYPDRVCARLLGLYRKMLES